MPRYTLAEHETLDHFVVAVAVAPKLESRAKQHMGLIFEDYAQAEAAADAINEWASIESLHPNRVAHLTGFSAKCRIDGQRLYIPIVTPDTAIKDH
ncbi:hypothetical protein [Streptomyces sp. NPDC059819]|uniref:hypothetical protein n=1 Tax=Streptomyces sp. NPDC059819 TaxID=3346963 RepID=UPI003658F5EC